MKIQRTKTRWYFSAVDSGVRIEGCVEFSRNGLGKKQVNIYDYSGRTLLWHSTGVDRMTGHTAKMAFQVYAEQERKKTK